MMYLLVAIAAPVLPWIILGGVAARLDCRDEKRRQHKRKYLRTGGALHRLEGDRLMAAKSWFCAED